MEHFCNLLFQLMKHGTNTLHVGFISLFSINHTYIFHECYERMTWVSSLDICIYLTRQVSYEQILIYNDGLHRPNPDDAGPIVPRPITAGFDTALESNQGVCSDALSTEMQCLRPLCHSSDTVYSIINDTDPIDKSLNIPVSGYCYSDNHIHSITKSSDLFYDFHPSLISSELHWDVKI